LTFLNAYFTLIDIIAIVAVLVLVAVAFFPEGDHVDGPPCDHRRALGGKRRLRALLDPPGGPAATRQSPRSG
jgi:hypothetical protein